MQLRQYQETLLNQLLIDYQQYDSILLQLCTGAGKTILAAKLIKSILERIPQGQIFFCCNRIELIQQTSNVFKEYNIPHSFISGEFPYDPNERLYICTVQTLHRQLKYLQQPLLFILDECHLGLAPIFGKCIQAAKDKGAKILGLTATPKSGHHGLGSIFQHMILGPSIKELIQQQWLSIPSIYVPEATARLVAEHEGEWSIKQGDYDPKAINQFVMDNKIIYGDTIEHFRKLNPENKPTAVFCASVKHVYQTVEMLQEADITAAGIDGTMSKQERAVLLEKFRNNEITCMVSCELLLIGYDYPECFMGIWLRPTKSLTVWLQGNGRLMRVTPNKNSCIILDQVDNTSRLGPSFIDRHWQLEGYGERKKRDSVSGLSLKLCTKCGNYAPNSVIICPICGAVWKSRLKQFKVLYEQLQCITMESAQKLIEDQCNKIIQREKNRMTVRDKAYYLDKAVEWKIKGDHDEWADFKVRQDKENTRIYFEGTEAELLVMFAKRKSCKDPVAETKKALEARKVRGESGSRQATVQIFESGTDEEILEYIKREKPDVTNPEAYLAGIKRKRVGAVLENGTPEQKAEALKLTERKQEDRFDKMVSFAKSGKLTPRDESAPRVYTDEEANGFAAAVVRKDNKGKIDGGSKSDLLEVAAALHIPEERRDKWAEAVLSTRH